MNGTLIKRKDQADTFGETGIIAWCLRKLRVKKETKSQVAAFCAFLGARGIATRVVEDQDATLLYVALADAAERPHVTAAQDDVIDRFGTYGFELIVLYPEDLQREFGQRLFSGAATS